MPAMQVVLLADGTHPRQSVVPRPYKLSPSTVSEKGSRSQFSGLACVQGVVAPPGGEGNFLRSDASNSCRRRKIRSRRRKCSYVHECQMRRERIGVAHPLPACVRAKRGRTDAHKGMPAITFAARTEGRVTASVASPARRPCARRRRQCSVWSPRRT